MGAVNNDGGAKFTYYSLKQKVAKFEHYQKDQENTYYDSMQNVLIEKVGRRQKKLKSGPVFWEYCLLCSDLDDEGAKIIITIPNFGDTLMRVFGPLLGLDSMSALDLSPYRSGKYFRFAIRKHGEKETVKYPFEWSKEEGWFVGVPKTIWKEVINDGIATNESDDSELKAFILEKLKPWCQKVLGTPFEQVEVGQRIFDSSSSASTPGTQEVGKFVEDVLKYYVDLNVLAANWHIVIDRANKAFNGDQMTMDFFYKEMSEKAQVQYGTMHDVVCSKDKIEIEETTIIEDDLPF